MAKLYFRYGVMGSSKTANALMVRYNYEERGQRVLQLRHAVTIIGFGGGNQGQTQAGQGQLRGRQCRGPVQRLEAPARQFCQQGGQALERVVVAWPVLVQGKQAIHAVLTRLQRGQCRQVLAVLLVSLFQRKAAAVQGVAELMQVIAVAKQPGAGQQADQAGGQRSLAHALAALP